MSDDLEAKSIRARIEIEDNLLNSRTNIFLAINALWVAAVGIGGNVILQRGIVVLGIVVCLMWAISSLQSLFVIRGLTIAYLTLSTSESEKIVQFELSKPAWEWLKWRPLKWLRKSLRPTNVLAAWLPLLFLLAWLIFLFHLIANPLLVPNKALDRSAVSTSQMDFTG
jgi:hypothetical protein